MGIDLALNNWYFANGNNNVSTNSAGIYYRVTRTSEQALANKASISIRPVIWKTVQAGAWNYNQQLMTIKCGAQEKTSYTAYNLQDGYGDDYSKQYLTSAYPFKRISGNSDPFTFEVDYNSDGTLDNLNLYALIPLENSSSGNDHIVDIYIDLPFNPRNAVIGDIPNFTFDGNENVGVAFSLPYTKYDSSQYLYLQVSVGTLNMGFAEEAIQNKQLIIPNAHMPSIYTEMADVNSATFTFELRTFSDTELTQPVGVSSIKTATGIISPTGRPPTFAASNISYVDNNSVTKALIGSPYTKVIKGYSNISISVNETATANKHATMGNAGLGYAYLFEVEEKSSQNAAQSSPFSAIVKTFNAMAKDKFTVTAVDSRGNTTPVIVNLGSNFIDYEPPVISAGSAIRDNDFDELTKISFSGKIYAVNFGAVSNVIESIIYKYKDKNEHTIWTTNELTDIKTGITYNPETGEFSLSGRYINGDLNTSGFDSNKSYDVQIIVTDKITSYTFTTEIKSGIPGLVLDKVSDATTKAFIEYIIGVGMLPVEGRSISAKGKIYANENEECLTDVSIFDKFYPIGTIYQTENADFDPNVEWGGTWSKIEGRMLIGADGTYINGSTGGEATHALTTSEMPAHAHNFKGANGVSWDANALNVEGSAYASYPGVVKGVGYTSSGYIYIKDTGGGAAHNNLPPYRAVFIWERTA